MKRNTCLKMVGLKGSVLGIGWAGLVERRAAEYPHPREGCGKLNQIFSLPTHGQDTKAMNGHCVNDGSAKLHGYVFWKKGYVWSLTDHQWKDLRPITASEFHNPKAKFRKSHVRFESHEKLFQILNAEETRLHDHQLKNEAVQHQYEYHLYDGISSCLLPFLEFVPCRDDIVEMFKYERQIL